MLMPIAPSPRMRPTRALIIGFVGAAVGIAVIIGIVLLFRRDGGGLESGEFRAGQVEVLENQVEENGPIIYTSPGNFQIAIFVSQLADMSWTAFETRRLGCENALEWDSGAKVFADPCSRGVFLNAAGCVDVGISREVAPGVSQLRHYGVRIADRQLIVNLGQPNDGFCSN